MAPDCAEPLALTTLRAAWAPARSVTPSDDLLVTPKPRFTWLVPLSTLLSLIPSKVLAVPAVVAWTLPAGPAVTVAIDRYCLPLADTALTVAPAPSAVCTAETRAAAVVDR